MSMNKAEARRLARKTQAELRAEDEAKERRAREARERAQRERRAANENDVVSFLQANAAIETAQTKCAAVVAGQERLMGEVIGRIVEREGNMSRAAKLLNITVHQARKLQRDAAPSLEVPEAAESHTGESEQGDVGAHDAPSVEVQVGGPPLSPTGPAAAVNDSGEVRVESDFERSA